MNGAATTCRAMPRELRRGLEGATCEAGLWRIGQALPTCEPVAQTLTEFRRREFAITDTEDNAIAAAAIIGDRRSPVIG